jgi:hypothetical protein
MAERRMISKDLVTSYNFLCLSISAQRLYFFLVLETDDEGFVGNYRRIIKSIDGEMAEILELQTAGFIITFDTYSLVVVHFMKQNKIKVDRVKHTNCVDELAMLEIENDCYKLKKE